MKKWTDLDTIAYLGSPAQRPGPVSEFLGFLAALVQILWCTFPGSLDVGFPAQWNRQIYESLCTMLPSVVAWLLAMHACYVSRGRRSKPIVTTLLLVIFYETTVSVLKLNTFYRWF